MKSVSEEYISPQLHKLALSMQRNQKSNALHEMSLTPSIIHGCAVHAHILMMHVTKNAVVYGSCKLFIFTTSSKWLHIN